MSAQKAFLGWGVGVGVGQKNVAAGTTSPVDDRQKNAVYSYFSKSLFF